jgi:AraC family transcriptional regulator
MQPGIVETVKPLCRPYTVSHFEIEHKIESNGIHADIRRFGWNYTCDASFEANAYYIDYSLTRRSTGTRLLNTGRRPTGPPGQIVFLPAGSVFDAHCEPSEHRLLCLTFEHSSAMRLFESEEPVFGLPPCLDVRAPRVRQALGRLAEEVRGPGFGHDVLIESIALTLAVDLCRHLRDGQTSAEPLRGRMADWLLRRLKDRIEAGLSGPLSIADLAAECRMSSRHLIRTFKNTEGMTLTDYIAAARTHRAKRELAREDALIKVVAGNCGFQSAAAFSASFRKATGMTPKQFRQEHFRTSGLPIEG